MVCHFDRREKSPVSSKFVVGSCQWKSMINIFIRHPELFQDLFINITPKVIPWVASNPFSAQFLIHFFLDEKTNQKNQGLQNFG